MIPTALFGPIEACRRQLADNPLLVAARFELARLLLTGGEAAGAGAVLRSALTLEPAARDLWLLAAAGLTMTDQDRAALQALRWTLILDPASIDATILLAQTLMRLGQPQATEAAFRGTLAQLGATPPPAATRLFNEFGCFRSQAGDEVGAAALFERALILAPDSASAINNLANACSRLGLLCQGLAAYRRALAIAADPAIEGNLASLLLEAGDKIGARRHLAGARVNRPRDPGLLDLGARLAIAEQSPDEALRAYQACLAAAPDYGPGWINLGFVHENGGRPEAARTAWRRGLTLTVGTAQDDAGAGPPDAAHAAMTLALAPALGLARAKLALYGQAPAAGTRLVPLDRFDDPDCPVQESVTLNATDRLLWCDDVTVHHDQWYLLIQGRLLLDLVFPFPVGEANFVRAYGVNGQALVKDLPVIEEDSAPAFLLAGATNYYHWLLDYLPRLRWALPGTTRDESGPADPAELPILVNRALAPYQQRSLDWLGVDRRRLRSADRPGLHHYRRLAIPHRSGRIIDDYGVPVWQQPQFDPDALDWLRAAFGARRQDGRGGRRIMISRRGAAFRRCVNEAAIQKLAERHGFVVVTPETLDFVDQVALFAACDVVLGVHGAGFANMVFAPRQATLIELHPTAEAPPFFVGLCQARGQRHIAIPGQPVQALRPMTRHFWDFSVDLAAVAAALDTL